MSVFEFTSQLTETHPIFLHCATACALFCFPDNFMRLRAYRSEKYSRKDGEHGEWTTIEYNI